MEPRSPSNSLLSISVDSKLRLQTIESSWTFAYGFFHICYFNLNYLQVSITRHLVCSLISLGFLNPIKLKTRLITTLYLNGEISKFSEFIPMHCFLFRDHRAKDSTRQEEMCFVVVISFKMLCFGFIAVVLLLFDTVVFFLLMNYACMF